MLTPLLASWLLATLPDPIATAPARPEVVVMIRDFAFVPAKLTVHAGTHVRFTNLDGEPHTVTSLTGLFDSAALDTQGTWSYTFEKPGAYPYYCTVHPMMTGVVTVTP